MSQIVIKNIEHTDKTSREGKPYTSCRITVWNKTEQKDTFISGFGSALTKTWGPGDVVDVKLSQNEKGYWNFDLNESSKPAERAEIGLLRQILAELQQLNGKKVEPTTATPQPVETELVAEQPGKPAEVQVEDIPF